MPLAFTWLAYAETDSGGSILLGIFDTFEGALGMVRAPAVGRYVVERRLLHCKETAAAVEAAFGLVDWEVSIPDAVETPRATWDNQAEHGDVDLEPEDVTNLLCALWSDFTSLGMPGVPSQAQQRNSKTLRATVAAVAVECHDSCGLAVALERELSQDHLEEWASDAFEDGFFDYLFDPY